MRLAPIRVGGTRATRAVRVDGPALAEGTALATGTPGGVGAGRKPPRFSAGGETVTARVEGVGETVNKVVTEVAP